MIFILNIHYGNTDDCNHAAGDDTTDDNNGTCSKCDNIFETESDLTLHIEM